jgi:hypothetical protein
MGQRPFALCTRPPFSLSPLAPSAPQITPHTSCTHATTHLLLSRMRIHRRPTIDATGLNRSRISLGSWRCIISDCYHGRVPDSTSVGTSTLAYSLLTNADVGICRKLPYSASSASTSTSQDHVRHYYTHEDHASPSLNSLCLRFLHKMNVSFEAVKLYTPLRLTNAPKKRFGTQSQESGIIHEVLDAFQNRKVTKRHAHATVIDTLGRQDDLKKDLMDILYHRDSKWALGDFNLPVVQPERPERSVPQPTPMFLEPTHYPQMRMPSALLSWSPASLASHSIDPAVLSTYTGCGSKQSPRLVTTPTRFDCSPTFGNPTADQPATTPSSSSFDFDTPTGALNHRLGGDLAQDHVKTNIEPSRSIQGRDYKNHLRLPVPSYQISAYQVMSWNSYSIEASSEALDVPRTLSLPRIVMPLSAERCNLNESCADTTIGGQPNERPGLLEGHSLPSVVSDSSFVENQANPAEAGIPPVRRSAARGPFIHAICGKAFTSRYKVKKHHWGVKNDDVATTTGCWAKHGKPNSDWDDHGSCKMSSTGARAAKMKDTTRMHRGHPMTASGVEAGSTLQAWTKAPKMLPGFPTLQDLPQTVAAALKTHGEDEYMHSGEAHWCTQHAHWDESEDVLTGFDACLGAGTPKREERNDSVMSHAEAWDAAAEHGGQDMV